MTDKIQDLLQDLLIELKANIFYRKNKKTGVSKEFIELLYFRLPNTQNILKLIKSTKNKEELKRKAKEHFSLISKDICLTNFIDGLQFGNYSSSATYYVDKKALKIMLNNNYSLEETNQIIEEYKDIIFQYIISNNLVKNSIERGTTTYNDFTKTITLELLDSIIQKLTVDASILTPEEQKKS